MTEIETYCDYHLGDQLVYLNYLRKLAVNNIDFHFVHACNDIYLPQLQDLICDLKNVSLISNKEKSYKAIDVWKNRKEWFYTSPLRSTWLGYHLWFFQELSKILNLECPIKTHEDFLFDYPALLSSKYEESNIDVLVVNSPPHSCQLSSFTQEQFDILIQQLLNKKYKIAATCKRDIQNVLYTPPLSITGLGNLAIKCKFIVGVLTGPMWTTFNIYANPLKYVVCLDCGESIDFSNKIVNVKKINDIIKEID